MRTLLRGLTEPGGSEQSKCITIVKPNYFLSGRKTEHDAFRTGIKSGSCVKYEGTVHAITSSPRGCMTVFLENVVGSWRLLRLPPLTLVETVMCFWDVKWSSRFGGHEEACFNKHWKTTENYDYMELCRSERLFRVLWENLGGDVRHL